MTPTDGPLCVFVGGPKDGFTMRTRETHPRLVMPVPVPMERLSLYIRPDSAADLVAAFPPIVATAAEYVRQPLTKTPLGDLYVYLYKP